MMKSISGGVIFKEYPEVKKQLWGGQFWEDGYFVRTIGDKVTAEVIKNILNIIGRKRSIRINLNYFRESLDAPPCRRGASLTTLRR
jgi:hypothetical protein